MVLACLSSPWAAGAAGKQGIIYNLPGAPVTLDPTYAYDPSGLTAVLNMFEGLLRFDESHRPQPAMASAWTVSPDGLVYRFTLREAFWSNGQPVTAQDFAYAWLRALTPGDPADGTPFLYAIANAEAYHKGSLRDPKQVGIRAVNARTLEVTLAKPLGHFLTLCCYPPFLPVNRRAVESDPAGWCENPKTAAANGPYRLLEKRESLLVLAPNPYYWQKGRSRGTTVTLTWLKPDEIGPAYAAGLLDGALDPPRNLNGRYLDREELRLSFLLFNLRRPPFDKLLVRQAVAGVLDRAAVARAAAEIPAFAVVPPGLPDAEAGKEFRATGGGMLFADRDPNLARQRLALAGHPGGLGVPPLDLVYVSDIKRNKIFADAVATGLAEIGLRAVHVPVSWEEYQRRLSAGEFALARVGWLADCPDPYAFLSLFAADAATNYGGYRNDQFELALREALTAAEPAGRAAALHRAEAQLAADLPLVPVTYGKRSYLEQPDLRDVVHLYIGVPYFRLAWLAQKKP